MRLQFPRLRQRGGLGDGQRAEILGGTIENCGGYGSLYASFGGAMVLENLHQRGNAHGNGLMALHEGSHIR